jgi:hypothetical protein
MNIDSFSCQENILEGDIVLMKMSKKSTYIICRNNALLKLKVEKSLIYLVGTQILTVSKTE